MRPVEPGLTSPCDPSRPEPVTMVAHAGAPSHTADGVRWHPRETISRSLAVASYDSASCSYFHVRASVDRTNAT